MIPPREDTLQRGWKKRIVQLKKDLYKGYVECANMKIDLPNETFYGEQDSMKKNSGKNGEKLA
jgi:hypothetical protein